MVLVVRPHSTHELIEKDGLESVAATYGFRLAALTPGHAKKKGKQQYLQAQGQQASLPPYDLSIEWVLYAQKPCRVVRGPLTSGAEPLNRNFV